MPTVETNGIETYYEEHGEGPPLVVLHDAVADHKVWAEQLQPLTDEYWVIVYDLRGHGKTGTAPRDAYTVAHYVADLKGLIVQLSPGDSGCVSVTVSRAPEAYDPDM